MSVNTMFHVSPELYRLLNTSSGDGGDLILSSIKDYIDGTSVSVGHGQLLIVDNAGNINDSFLEVLVEKVRAKRRVFLDHSSLELRRLLVHELQRYVKEGEGQCRDFSWATFHVQKESVCVVYSKRP